MSSDRSVTDILTISAQRDGDRVAIALVGELDYHGAERMAVELGALIAAPATRVEMDATGLTFVDSSGLRAIMLARAKAHDIGATFRISTASLVVERVIEIAGLAGVLLAPETDPT
jgi:anti-anti-sigma factor